MLTPPGPIYDIVSAAILAETGEKPRLSTHGGTSDGRFLIAGDFLPAYREKLAPLLSHPTVEVLGHRTDVAELMRLVAV